MFADERSKALVTNFAFQWLSVRGLDAAEPDAHLFPSFDEDLRQGFVEEMDLFLDSILRDNRKNVTELLTAPYTFVNERLARHYGIGDVRGERFRRVQLSDPNRWGVLGKGSVLLATSYPDRTSPVLRGAWIMEHLLGIPPTPPPPGVETNLTAVSLETAEIGARAARTASHAILVQPLPRRHRPARPSARELQRNRRMARTRARHRRRDRLDGRARRWSAGQQPGTVARGIGRGAGEVRADRHAESADIRARPGCRAPRHARRALDRARGPRTPTIRSNRSSWASPPAFRSGCERCRMPWATRASPRRRSSYRLRGL